MSVRLTREIREALENKHLPFCELDLRGRSIRDVIIFDIEDYTFEIKYEMTAMMGHIFNISWRNNTTGENSFCGCRLGCEVSQIIREIMTYGRPQAEYIGDSEDDEETANLFNI